MDFLLRHIEITTRIAHKLDIIKSIPIKVEIPQDDSWINNIREKLGILSQITKNETRKIKWLDIIEESEKPTELEEKLKILTLSDYHKRYYPKYYDLYYKN
jgi:hypothetical protein